MMAAHFASPHSIYIVCFFALARIISPAGLQENTMRALQSPQSARNESHIFEIFVPALTKLCALGFEILELCTFL